MMDPTAVPNNKPFAYRFSDMPDLTVVDSDVLMEFRATIKLELLTRKIRLEIIFATMPVRIEKCEEKNNVHS